MQKKHKQYLLRLRTPTYVLMCSLFVCACHPTDHTQKRTYAAYYTPDAMEENTRFTVYPARPLSLEAWASSQADTLTTHAAESDNTAAVPLRQIGLLLPLTGKLGTSGQAIRNGLLAAYYQFKSQHPTAQIPAIRVYDSARYPIETLYQRALNAGADWIIGPLTKSRIRHLLMAYPRPPVPTLVLNTLASPPHASDQLWFFGLSSTQEATQMATWAYQRSDLGRAAIITTQDPWGHRLAAQFSQQWEMLGGQIVSTLYFDQSQSINQDIRTLLQIDQSEQRAQTLKRIIHPTSFRFLPQIRQDIDALFLALMPQQAKQVRSFLNFHYAGHIPVFGISTLYASQDWEKNNAPDIEGVYFSDIPWMILPETKWSNTQKQLRHSVEETWTSSFKKHPRLYALGIDAFQLIYVLPQWSHHPTHTVSGLTGQLSLSESGIITHVLPVAKIRHGRRQMVSMSTQ